MPGIKKPIKTCLVVEDSAFDRLFLRRGVTSLGFSVAEASNAKEALAICRETMPDYILLNWEMPGMNGIEMLEALRKMPGGTDVQVFICTANSHPSYVGHAYVRGVNGYLTKPITHGKLEEKLTSTEAMQF